MDDKNVFNAFHMWNDSFKHSWKISLSKITYSASSVTSPQLDGLDWPNEVTGCPLWCILYLETCQKMLRYLVRQDRQLTVREINEEVNILMGSRYLIITKNMSMKRNFAEFVSWIPKNERHDQCWFMAFDLFEWTT